ncbi:MAG: hypothetical protein AAF497_29540, partial [Planctomycetota bacterium]
MKKQLAATSRQLRALQKQADSQHPELIRHIALRLDTWNDELAQLGQGRIAFSATETWRTIYERVLSRCQVRRYLSVALIRSDSYWQDLPGRASLEFNFQLVEHGFTVQRTFIIDPFFWPPSAKTP